MKIMRIKFDIKEINRLTRQFLKIQIFKADDVYQAAHGFNNKMEAEGLNPSIRDIIIDIISDDEIIGKMAFVKGLENSLKIIFRDINTIEDKSYETRTNCCPTYWTLMKRFL